MAATPPPYPPYSPQTDWKQQRRLVREHAKAQRDLSRAQWKMYRDQRRDQALGARRGSLLGPLLLISLGIIFFLLRLGRLSYGTVATWYERWWPLLLLSGGIVLLVEWAFERSRSADHPYTSRVGGGVVTLIVLLCVPGIIFNVSRDHVDMFRHGFGVTPDNIDEFLGDRHESDQVLDQVIAPNARLIVNNPRGNVTVTGVSSDGRVHVAIHKQVFSRSDSDASEKARQLAPTLTGSAESLVLDLHSVEGTRSDLTITLPSGTETTITADHGNVNASLLTGAVTVTANHGDVEVEDIGGSVTTHINSRGASFTAHAVTGSISLEGNCRDVDMEGVGGAVTLRGDFFGTTHLERVGGPVLFHTTRTDFQLARLDGQVEIKRGDLSGDRILGPVTLSARSYNVNLDRVAGDVSLATSDGTVELRSVPPLGNVTIQNRNGSVNLTLPEHAAFTVQAETRDGDVETEFPLAKTDENQVSRLTGTIGSGGAQIRINTTQDDISLKKGAVGELMPLIASPPIPTLPGAPSRGPAVPHLPKAPGRLPPVAERNF